MQQEKVSKQVARICYKSLNTCLINQEDPKSGIKKQA